MSVPIVGIGASAGGLKSIFELIAGIPASTGMAYVFVQHLDPRHGSDLAKILSKRTAFPVEEVVEGVEISPDHLYVIIPNTTLTISNDVLRLAGSRLLMIQRSDRFPVILSCPFGDNDDG
jgi:two-component system, chemotaxis family, CheB/CheR fusion protein